MGSKVISREAVSVSLVVNRNWGNSMAEEGNS